MSKNLWKSDPDWFEPWFNRPEYHVLYGDRSQTEADDFIKTLVNQTVLGENGQRILDLGCGAGRHAAAMASHGNRVIGMDLSSNSIASARSMHADLHDRLDFREGDMRNIDSYFDSNSFEVVTMLFTSFGYFESDEEHSKTLQSVRRVLSANGTFILDFLNLDHVNQNLIPSERIEKGDVLFDINRRIAGGWIQKSIEFKDANGVQHHHVERVKAFSPEDLTEMLTLAGFDVIEKFGNYQLLPLAKSSPRCIIVAH